MTEPAPEQVAVKKGWDGKLSYSSFSQYMSCNKKYYLRKVKVVRPDPDAEEDSKAFRFGKAFHEILENAKHNLNGVTKSVVETMCTKYQLDLLDDAPHLFAMLRHYKKLQEKNGLTATHFEVEIATKNFLGYIDCILTDKDGGWWIGDLKTASAYSPQLNSRVHMDWQLNLYAHHAKEIAEKVGYKLEDFRGCRYLLNVKSKMKRKEDDNFKSYAERLERAMGAYDIPVMKDEMDPESVYSLFQTVHKDIATLHKAKPVLAEAMAAPNHTNCFSYYRPCEFFAQCHRKTFTELKTRNVISSVE